MEEFNEVIEDLKEELVENKLLGNKNEGFARIIIDVHGGKYSGISIETKKLPGSKRK